MERLPYESPEAMATSFFDAVTASDFDDMDNAFVNPWG